MTSFILSIRGVFADWPMIGALALVLAFPVYSEAESSAISVTIIRRAPIETLSPAGEVIGVSESTVGAKFIWVSATTSQVTLRDDKGSRYVIATSATDYNPPPSTATLSSIVPSKPATNSISTAQQITPSASSTGNQNAQNQIPTGDPVTISIGERSTAKAMAVWPAGGIAGRPLLIAAHGNGGNGPGEINGWLSIAKTHRFTVVCPSFLSSVHTRYLPDDEPYFTDCIRWIQNNLQYDKDNVFMTGLSGGGFPTWYLATKRDDFFRGICLESANFAGEYYGLDLSRWFNKPIKLIWGSEDLPDIPVQNQKAVDFLNSEHCKNFTFEVVPGGHHEEHPDMVVQWMEKQAASQPSN